MTYSFLISHSPWIKYDTKTLGKFSVLARTLRLGHPQRNLNKELLLMGQKFKCRTEVEIKTLVSS